MRRYIGLSLVLMLVGGPVLAAEPRSKLVAEQPKTVAEGKVVLENWDAAYLEGNKAGYVHTIVRLFERDEGKIYRTSTELKLTVKRFNDTITLGMETGSEEDADGKVTAVSMKQLLGKDQQLVLTGKVDGKQLHVLADEVRMGQATRRLDRKIPWNDKVVGMYQQERLFREKQVKPGDKFSYLSYEPTINTVVTTRVSVHDFEEVEVRGGKKRLLLRVTAVPDKIEVKDASIQMPSLTAWLDKEYATVRSQVEVPGLGKLTLYRGTREEATGQSGPVAQIKDIGISQLIRLNVKVPRPYDTASAVYRVTIKGEDDPGSAFARDGRQKVKNVKGNSLEVHVRAARGPQEAENPGKAGDEFLTSNFYIASADARVKAHAAAAVGKETDAWKKAVRIERWVRDHMQNKNFTEAFATADHVARTLEGDCTEHAVLAAAMCRAAGVPSRTAFGLLYIDGPRGPSMGFHMWFEVFVRGQWIPLDATLGKGYVGATHLKISDHSWHDTQSLTPLLPVVRVVGKVTIEMLSVNAED